MAGVLLGVAWLLVLGIAYRRHSTRSFWMRPLAWTFYGSFALAAVWYRRAPRMRRWPGSNHRHHTSPWPRRIGGRTACMTPAASTSKSPETCCHCRNDCARKAGGFRQVRTGCRCLACSMRPARFRGNQCCRSHWMRIPRHCCCDAGQHAGRIEVLRVWPAPARLEDGTPLWVARFETMQARKRLRLLMLWKPMPTTTGLPADICALAVFPHVEKANGRARIRTDAP